MTTRVAVVGAGLIGGKRAAALSPDDELLGVHDTVSGRAIEFAERFGTRAFVSLQELLAEAPDVVVVATTHDALAAVSVDALDAGAHVLVEKPAGLCVADIDRISEASRSAGRLVKVGFNHRFHPGIRQAIADVRSGDHGPIMFMRARYGHGGRVGYEREWRADAERSGGGELIDQGMHLIDLSHALHGDLPLHSALVHTDFWDMDVDDNAVVTLGAPGRAGPWTMFHVSCSEWKNLFDLEIYCKRAKWHVTGLAGSYGPQILRIFRMKPEMGPPEVEEVSMPGGDVSWENEWQNFRAAIAADDSSLLDGDLGDARYAHAVVQEIYRASGFRDADGRAIPRDGGPS